MNNNNVSDKIKLFVVTHKEFEKWADDRIVISVGNANLSCAQLKDNIFDNIARKNSSFCELTALYWIWKNCQCEFVGLEHYRRYFMYKGKPLDAYHAMRFLDKHDIILPDKYYTKDTIYQQYKESHYSSDLDITREIVGESCSFYLDAMDIVLNGHGAYYFNMFVARKSLIDSYCAWVFPILFELERRINNDERDAYQKRTFGFIAERLFNVYLVANNIDNIKSLFVKGMNKNGLQRVARNLINKIKYR